MVNYTILFLGKGMNLLSRILKDPLTHFLLAGCALFLLFKLLQPDQESQGRADLTVTLDRNELIHYLKSKIDNFDAQKWEEMTNEQIESYINNTLFYTE